MSNDVSPDVSAHMGSFPFMPGQYPQRETQKNYVFVDEHNRHKRLKVMRACEGCRRRKIKCDAATTNTWPCSACIRLKLHCVRSNSYDGSSDSMAPAAYDAVLGQMALQPKHAADVYSTQPAFGPDVSPYQSLPFESHHNLHYTTVPAPLADHAHQLYRPPPSAFPTPPLQQAPRPDSSSEACSTDSYQQQDLADLLGTFRVNELGTAPYLRNKASFRRHEMPAVEYDDFDTVLLPITTAPGHRIRVPPELMPDDAAALHYFDLYFSQVHPYVPVLDKAQFYRQWDSARDTISPLILEALFAMEGRLAEDPAQGHQWLTLASRHANCFMDVPRLSTLQALLMILKAREAAPKRGYYYRSWMTVVQCVQMGKDLGLDEHYEDYQAGRPCDSSPAECRLRTRIWQTIFVCEVMVGTPQSRHDLSVNLESVDFSVPSRAESGDDGEYLVSRNFTYFARLVRNIGRMSKVYAKIGRKREWGMDPEFQQLSQSISSFLSELPAELAITFPPDSSPPWIASSFVGNLHSYSHLTLILYHRLVLSFLDPTANESQWKHHMTICYDAAKALSRLQESIMQTFGLAGLQAMQRGFSFTVYAGLSCIVLHLVGRTVPEPRLDAALTVAAGCHRVAGSRAQRRRPRVLYPPHEDHGKGDGGVDDAGAPEADRRRPRGLLGRRQEAFCPQAVLPVREPALVGPPQPAAEQARPPDQPRGNPHAQPASYPSRPISPPVSAGAGDGKSDSPGAPSLVLMPPDGQGPGLSPDAAMPSSQPAWNPARIFEQWNTSFGSPAQAEPATAAQTSSLVMAPPTDGSQISAMPAAPGVEETLAGAGAQQLSAPAFSAPAPMVNFIKPAMWQESVASVYEEGLKRSWDYDAMQAMKRP